MTAKIMFFLVVLTIGTTCAQEPQISLTKEDLPPALSGLDTEEVKNKTLTALEEKCEKNGGPQAFANAKNAAQDLNQCFSKHVNVTQLSQEVEDAKPNGTVDEVFKKYCAKKSLLIGCVKNSTEATKACMTVDEQKQLKIVYNVSEQLAEFICFKEGDRIALFIAEGGKECFSDKQEQLQKCFNGTTVDSSNLMEAFDPNTLSNLTLSFDEQQCHKLFDVQECVVAVLNECPKPTSANIVESLFKFIKKSTPCNKFEKPSSPGAAASMFVATTTLVMAATVALFV